MPAMLGKAFGELRRERARQRIATGNDAALTRIHPFQQQPAQLKPHRLAGLTVKPVFPERLDAANLQICPKAAPYFVK